MVNLDPIETNCEMDVLSWIWLKAHFLGDLVIYIVSQICHGIPVARVRIGHLIEMSAIVSLKADLLKSSAFEVELRGECFIQRVDNWEAPMLHWTERGKDNI